jgi:putative polyhydroxyalkanoate system protein
MAKPVTVTLDHDKTPEELRRKIDENLSELTDGLAGKIALKVDRRWEGDTLHFGARAMMQKVTGTIELFPQHVRITVVLPNMLAGMAEKVSGQIQKKGAVMLEDKTST